MQLSRTHTCGALTEKEIDATVVLQGWLHKRRDLGGLIFLDIRDRFGITQIIIDTKNDSLCQQAASLKLEWVIAIKGRVKPRQEGMVNPHMATGAIEVEAAQIMVLSKAQTTPFVVNDDKSQVHEEMRLRYRYLDLRRKALSSNLVMRHKAMLAVRNFLSSEEFLEISTPLLAKSTPEGARDYLVPSRIHPGSFYALPQSPQIFKQLLMIGGMDRYFQIAPCFRDEDLRADRQPEFTQIDIEMSFATTDELFHLIEKLMVQIFHQCLSISIAQPFPRISYQDCLEHYGCDKPDIRYDMRLVRLTDIALSGAKPFFKTHTGDSGIVKGLRVEKGAEFSRKKLEELAAYLQTLNGQTLFWAKCSDRALASGIAKQFSDEEQRLIVEKMRAKDGDLLFFVAGSEHLVNQALDHLRRKLAKELHLADPSEFAFLWVIDFPLFKADEDTGRIQSEHHPFTHPKIDDMPLLATDPLKMRSMSYDLVLNGYELASGSKRIHDSDLQARIFDALQLSSKEIEEKFGFFIEALSYGTPPHLGAAIGLDRLVMILCGTENIRDVIAFPKTQKAADLMMEAPSSVTTLQLQELKLLIEK